MTVTRESRWLTPEDIEAAKATGRQRKPLTQAQKQMLRDEFDPLVVAHRAQRRTAQRR